MRLQTQLHMIFFRFLSSTNIQSISIFIITFAPYCMCLHCFRLTVLMFVLSALQNIVVLSLLTFVFLLFSCHKELQVSLWARRFLDLLLFTVPSCHVCVLDSWLLSVLKPVDSFALITSLNASNHATHSWALHKLSYSDYICGYCFNYMTQIVQH